MPSAMVHLSVAVIMAEKLKNIEDRPGFLLGSISPDAVSVRGGVTRADRRLAHFNGFGKSFEKLDENGTRAVNDAMLSFLFARKHSADYPFWLGYVVHVITDILWAVSVAQSFDAATAREDVPENGLRQAYEEDLTRLDNVLLRAPWLRDAFAAISGANGAKPCDGLSSPEMWEIATWRDTFLDINDSPREIEPMLYMSEKEIARFIETAADSLAALFNMEA